MRAKPGGALIRTRPAPPRPWSKASIAPAHSRAAGRDIPPGAGRLYPSATANGWSDGAAGRHAPLRGDRSPSRHRRSSCRADTPPRRTIRHRQRARSRRAGVASRRMAVMTQRPHRIASSCYRGDEAEGAEQDEDRSRRRGQPGEHAILEEPTCADAGGERRLPGSHPGGVGPLASEDRPVGGKFGPTVGTVDLLDRAVLQRAGALRRLRVCLIGIVRGSHQPTVTVMRCQAVER